MATDARLPGGTLRLSSARLALLYAVLVTVFTSVLLLAVYLLTRNALEREISAVVRAEVDDLSDDLRLGGIAQVACDPAPACRQLGTHRRGVPARGSELQAGGRQSNRMAARRAARRALTTPVRDGGVRNCCE